MQYAFHEDNSLVITCSLIGLGTVPVPGGAEQWHMHAAEARVMERCELAAKKGYDRGTL
jgi:hypothetical protein